MGLRRPAEAESVLRQALQHSPNDFNTQLLLAYALLEQERFDEAMPLFESLAATQAPWPRREGATSGYENWDRFSADIALATARSAANDNRGAEALLRERAAIGPDNAELQAALASIEARRGQTTQALQRNRMALTLDPHQKQARSGVVEAQRDLDRLDLADAAFASLQPEYPDDAGLQRLGASLERQRGWQVHLSHAWGHSENDTPTNSTSPLGNHFGSSLLEAESPLLGERWRVGLRARDDWADFQDTRVRYRSFWLGTHYRYDRLDFSAYGGRALDDFDRDGTAWALDAGWRFSDAWYGSVAWRTRDPEASLQARRLGITGDSIGAFVAGRPATKAAGNCRRASCVIATAIDAISWIFPAANACGPTRMSWSMDCSPPRPGAPKTTARSITSIHAIALQLPPAYGSNRSAGAGTTMRFGSDWK
nr:tetratricopeptide repeat protein [Xanthomonas sp. D-99]